MSQDNDPKPAEKPPEKSKKPQKRRVNLPLLSALVLIILSIFLFSGKSETSDKVTYNDLRMLVEKGPNGSQIIYDKEEKAADKGEKAEKKPLLKVSNLRNLQFQARQIVCEADVQQYQKPQKGQEKKAWGEPEETELTIGRVGLEDDGEKLYELARKKGFTDISASEPPSNLMHWLPTLLLFGMMVAVLFVILRRLGGAGAMAFGRNRGQFLEEGEINASFDDVAGVDEAADELREVVDFLRNAEKYRRVGARIPRGVLLVGPPGTGKTLLAKAVAGEANVPFLSISGSDFVELYVGIGAARVRDMFTQAQTKAPCIIFIDELDALGKTRGSGMISGNDEREQTLNALLVEMDGFTANSGVMVMAATNRPEVLDPALLRPGRFDRQVMVDRPDIAGREKILEVHAVKVKLASDVDLRKIAAMTSGFSGADLANLINEAALLTARENKDAVTMKELSEAIERVTAGLEKKQRVLQEEERRRVAYHEAAHALVAHVLPDADPVHKVSIIPRGFAALGYTMQRPEEDRFLLTRNELCSRIQVLLAGTLGEELVFEEISTGAHNDLERATELARSMVTDYGMSRLGRVTYRQTTSSGLLDGGAGTPREYSEKTAQMIDDEVKYLIDELIEGTRKVLFEKKVGMEALAKKLIEVEVVDAETLAKLL